MSTAAATLSPTSELSSQERAILEGTKVVHGKVSDRVLRKAYGPPRVALERSVLFTEAFQANEHDPLVLRWAKALKSFQRSECRVENAEDRLALSNGCESDPPASDFGATGL